MAAWQAELRHELLRAEGCDIVGLYLDLTKFYDLVSWRHLLLEGTAVQYPAKMICLALASYGLPRALKIGKHFSHLIEVANSMAAGCGQAVSLARAYLLRTMTDLQTPNNQSASGAGTTIVSMWMT